MFFFNHQYFLQNEGINNTNTAKSSNLPKIMPKLKIHLDMLFNWEKFPFGPIISPKPGPTLDKEDAAPEIEVIKSRPVKVSIEAKTKNIKI